MTFFNNIGKYISKNYRVPSQKYIRPDIITAALHLSLGEENLQAKEEIKPINSKKLTNQQNDMLVWKEIEASNIKFRKYRLSYIAAILNIVEHENNDVDKKLQELKEVERVCTNEK